MGISLKLGRSGKQRKCLYELLVSFAQRHGAFLDTAAEIKDVLEDAARLGCFLNVRHAGRLEYRAFDERYNAVT